MSATPSSLTPLQPSPPLAAQADLNLSIIGNCTYGALIDKRGCVQWCCLPRFDADPVFCSLLRRTNDMGFYDISIENLDRSEQYYQENTAILITKLYSKDGGCIKITDFAPRFGMFGRYYRPTMMIRIVEAVHGHPRIKVRVRPTFGYGWGTPEKTRGTNHIRYLLPNLTMRLTTNAPVSYIVDEVLFEVTETLNFIFMPDESLKESINELVQTYLEKTTQYWHDYVRNLSIPFEWQAQVIRSCITLNMCFFEETGAMVAALTSSIPVAPNETAHDLRFCWLRDSSSIIHTLNKLGSTRTMEEYLKYISNIVAGSQEQEGHIQPVYGIALETRLYEKEMHRLAGYRGMGPVRLGTRDYKLFQNDVYGQVVLSIAQMFFDRRLQHPGDKFLFERLEGIGKQAIKKFDQPDAGPLGLGDKDQVHTYSSAMCWVACDRLWKISKQLQLADRAQFWKESAERIHATVMEKAWNAGINSFTDTWGGQEVDAFLLTLPEMGFIKHQDPKFVGTLGRVEATLRKGKFLSALSSKKRGPLASESNHVSTTNTLWFINALAGVGRRDEARELFENLLKVCTPSGMLGEQLNPETGEQWGNFPKTTSMVALIECALRLSKDWEEVI